MIILEIVSFAGFVSFSGDEIDVRTPKTQAQHFS